MSADFNIVVLISGSGTTLKNLIDKRQAGELNANIQHVVASKPDASGIQFAADAGIEHSVVNFREIKEPEFSHEIFECCRRTEADLVVCGGFLRKLTVPDDFVNRVINIHPSLIPAFCGKGFYGIKVHQGVIDYGCKISGCTVHFVDNQYDHGPIIAQQSIQVEPELTAEMLAQKVFEQECLLYPEVINRFAAKRISVDNRVVRTQS